MSCVSQLCRGPVLVHGVSECCWSLKREDLFLWTASHSGPASYTPKMAEPDGQTFSPASARFDFVALTLVKQGMQQV